MRELEYYNAREVSSIWKLEMLEKFELGPPRSYHDFCWETLH